MQQFIAKTQKREVSQYLSPVQYCCQLGDAEEMPRSCAHVWKERRAECPPGQTGKGHLLCAAVLLLGSQLSCRVRLLHC